APQVVEIVDRRDHPRQRGVLPHPPDHSPAGLHGGGGPEHLSQGEPPAADRRIGSDTVPGSGRAWVPSITSIRVPDSGQESILTEPPPSVSNVTSPASLNATSVSMPDRAGVA